MKKKKLAPWFLLIQIFCHFNTFLFNCPPEYCPRDICFTFFVPKIAKIMPI